MHSHFLLVCAIVGAALLFDFINGFHDAANSIATLVSTRVLTPSAAVVWAAAFNFLAFAIFEPKVASTIGKGIVDPAAIDLAVIIGALGGAITWNLLTWWWGLPSSSSHALVGGLMGAGFAKGGLGILGWSKIGTIAAFIFVSPLVGFLAAGTMVVISSWLLRKTPPGRADRWLRPLRYLSAGAFSLSHGGNDAQKTMGIIVVLLFSQGYLGHTFPKGHEIPPGSCWLATLRWGWARCPGGGGSSRPWACASPSCDRTADSAPNWAGPRRSSWPPGSAFPCPRPTPSPAPSSGRRRLQPRQRALGDRGPDRVGLDLHHPRLGHG
jgi:phosphate/sulfate permease